MTLHTAIIALILYLVLVGINAAIDPYKALNIIHNPNGTITRLDTPPQSPPSPDPTLSTPVLSKDLTINQSKHTWARIYIPSEALDNSYLTKLPLIVFYHGGGFVFYNANSTNFHDFCIRTVNTTQSIVVSVDYRHAPEHRLPAAYQDSVEALHWIITSNDTWLTRHADYSRCYLMGDSAGGNIAYNVGLRAAAEIHRHHNHLKWLKIQGLVLIQPFFGGVKRTESEIKLIDAMPNPLAVADLLWNLSLPLGANRDNIYCNPTVKGGAKILHQIKLFGWKVAVFACYGDPLVDHQKHFVKLLQRKGVHVVGKFYEGGTHGIFVDEPSMSMKVFDIVVSL